MRYCYHYDLIHFYHLKKALPLRRKIPVTNMYYTM